MTAIVSILNKRAACIAADSAVTLGNGYKIHNSASKIFSLGEKHPVGVMIYGNSSFMKTPWEIIIKMYGRHIKDTPKDCLELYAQDFITFLYQKDFFLDIQNIESYLQNFIYSVHNSIKEKAISNNKSLFDMYKIYHFSFKKEEKCEELASLSFEDFLKLTTNTMYNIKAEIIASSINDFETNVLLEETLYEIIKAKDSTFQSSGIVFVGYGESDLYPKLVSYKISFPVNHMLRYFCDNLTFINNFGNEASIIPFAQTDVIETIISGINTSLLERFLTYTEKTLKQMYNSIVIELLTEMDNIPQNIENFKTEKFLFELSDKIQSHIRTEQVVPLLCSIGSLEKSELAEVAESLIALTTVKRKITFYTESVGGPIDVAIISKHEGFQWIKRK